ncbi:hypothetical protein F5Y10DRAFT_265258 [Nemania abortiva]|nr:hypothetical protein F5Y10DRAFT_265258 [Nemania abortiva]
MFTPWGYFIIAFTLLAFCLPLPILNELFAPLLFIAAPLLARANSYGAHPLVIRTCHLGSTFIFIDERPMKLVDSPYCILLTSYSGLLHYFIDIAEVLIYVASLKALNAHVDLAALPWKLFDFLIGL